jgi:hypothetical protein
MHDGLPNPFLFREGLKWLLIGSVGVILLTYALFQARFLIIGPQIVLSNEPAVQHNERRIFLEGTAFNISRLWLNDRQIYTDAQGNFKEALILENGYTVSTLRAEDRYGRTTTVSRSYVYTPASFVRN